MTDDAARLRMKPAMSWLNPKQSSCTARHRTYLHRAVWGCPGPQALASPWEREPMSGKGMQRLSFFLLMGLTLYASLFGAA